uniref:Ribosomal protein S3 n=1 Tax=Polyopes lancifolius TaxID=194517 RepID=A0A891T0R9_9FLOR|nr:ribosomal protein S3 [Polyopes lancifolius]QRM91053.1 ribosomal protein S3 [Polyopes lancifolius]
MAQKINPISLRLGLIQVWDSTLQNYGKLYINYSTILHSQLQIYQFLIHFFSFNKLLLGSKQLSHSSDKVLLNITHSNLIQGSDKNLLVQPPGFSNHFNGKILTRLYLRLQWFSTVDLVFNYVQYLLKQNIPLNKIFLNLCRLFENQLNSKKILYSTHGPIIGNLRGFKIRLSGRFDNSRNQMAKSIKYKVGSLSLMKLQSHVEFKNSEISTKLGTCGLQLWLFYEIY